MALKLVLFCIAFALRSVKDAQVSKVVLSLCESLLAARAEIHA